MPGALRLAVGTLTVLPVGAVGSVDRTVARGAMLLAPLAVLPLALVAAALAWGGAFLGWPGLVTGLVTVGVLALGTRALHLDGLADTVDGLGAGWDRARALEVMRRGDVGPMGAVALVLVVGLQAASIGAVVTDWPSAAVLALLVCCSRAVLTVACRRGVPAARSDGLGAMMAGTVPVAAVPAYGAVVTVLLGLVWPVIWGSPVTGVVSAVLAFAVAALVVARCVRRLGGVTGDVMGACVELAFTVLLLGAAAS